jgi:ABC-type transporter Mla subunit MlaD
MDLILAANRALAEDVGLLGVFLGLGIIVNVILVYIAIQVRGEHRANREYRSAKEHGEAV